MFYKYDNIISENLKKKMKGMDLIMKKLKEELKYGKKGITLISLVVTIIVLLILAGVTIATLIGDNGILNQATKAKEETQIASEDELRKLTMLEARTNLENTTYTDKNNETITIPAGFAVSQVDGENTIADGLVMIDQNGNEFVWIPVNDEKDYVRNTEYKNISVSSHSFDDTDYLPNGIENEKEAVLNAKGFFIGRYEAVDESATEERTSEKDGLLAVKRNKFIYTYITTDDMKEKSKSFINNDKVKSALMSGVQWDVVMGVIDGKKDGENNIFNVKTALNIRHTPSFEKSGQNEADKVYNIYDLEGNYIEVVAEKNNWASTSPGIRRGGSADGVYEASYRMTRANVASKSTFRIVLYVM